MNLKNKKTVILICAAAVIVLAVVAAVVGYPKQEKAPDLGEKVSVHDWRLPADWFAVRGKEGGTAVVADSTGTTTGWNLAHELPADWYVSTEIQRLAPRGDRDCARLVLGDKQANVCLAISLEYAGDRYVQVFADVLLNRGGRLDKDGWRNIYATKTWLAVDPDLPVILSAEHAQDDQILQITLKQNGAVILQDFSEDVSQDILDVLRLAGLGVHDSFVQFSQFTIRELD